MADVADAAGVSMSTVSHVLNQTRPVSEELRVRVQEAIEQLGYTPNAVARSLATSNTQLIGVVMTAVSNPYFAPLFSAIERTARRRGYTLMLTDSNDDPVTEASQVRIMLDRRADGLIIAPAGQAPDGVLELVARQKVPTVLIDRFSDSRFDEVGVENVNSTSCLVAHLAELGHTRIGFIGGQRGLVTTEERLNGYRCGLERAGLSFDRALARSGASRAEPARRATQSLLSSRKPPTAIISANNAMTVGVLRAVRDAGLQIPRDLALVAFDELDLADLISPALTTMAQPITEIGKRAIEMLLQRMADTDRPPRHVRMDANFVHRESCGCPQA